MWARAHFPQRLEADWGAHAQVPGLNAPIPPGAQFGYQPGGWGKPPVDEEGNPLYGDVFGLALDDGDDDVRPNPLCLGPCP